jgi:hypothetical protein
MTKQRNRRGNGQIVERGAGVFRLRYTIDGKRFSKTVTGTGKGRAHRIAQADAIGRRRLAC